MIELTQEQFQQNPSLHSKKAYQYHWGLINPTLLNDTILENMIISLKHDSFSTPPGLTNQQLNSLIWQSLKKPRQLINPLKDHFIRAKEQFIDPAYQSTLKRCEGALLLCEAILKQYPKLNIELTHFEGRPPRDMTILCEILLYKAHTSTLLIDSFISTSITPHIQKCTRTIKRSTLYPHTCFRTIKNYLIVMLALGVVGYTISMASGLVETTIAELLGYGMIFLMSISTCLGLMSDTPVTHLMTQSLPFIVSYLEYLEGLKTASNIGLYLVGSQSTIQSPSLFLYTCLGYRLLAVCLNVIDDHKKLKCVQEHLKETELYHHNQSLLSILMSHNLAYLRHYDALIAQCAASIAPYFIKFPDMTFILIDRIALSVILISILSCTFNSTPFEMLTLMKDGITMGVRNRNVDIAKMIKMQPELYQGLRKRPYSFNQLIKTMHLIYAYTGGNTLKHWPESKREQLEFPIKLDPPIKIEGFPPIYPVSGPQPLQLPKDETHFNERPEPYSIYHNIASLIYHSISLPKNVNTDISIQDMPNTLIHFATLLFTFPTAEKAQTIAMPTQFFSTQANAAQFQIANRGFKIAILILRTIFTGKWQVKPGFHLDLSPAPDESLG